MIQTRGTGRPLQEARPVRPELKAAFFLKKWCLGRLSASLPAVMFMWLSLGAWEKGPLCYFLSHSQNKRCFQEVALQLGRSRAMTPGSAGVDDMMAQRGIPGSRGCVCAGTGSLRVSQSRPSAHAAM